MYTTFLYCILFGLFYQRTESSSTLSECVAGQTYSETGWESMIVVEGQLTIVECETCSTCAAPGVVDTECTTTQDTVCVYGYEENLQLRKGQVRVITFSPNDENDNPCKRCRDKENGLGDLAECGKDESILIYSTADYQPSDEQQQCLKSPIDPQTGFNLGPWSETNPNELLGDIFTDDNCKTSSTVDRVITFDAKGTCLKNTIGLYYDENSGAGAYLCHYVLLYNENDVCNPFPLNWNRDLTQVRAEQCSNSFNINSGYISAAFELVNNQDLDQRWYRVYRGSDCEEEQLIQSTLIYLGEGQCRKNYEWPWTIFYSQHGLDCSSFAPTLFPSTSPSTQPSTVPSGTPSVMPSALPTTFPTRNPSVVPSTSPSNNPTVDPTVGPTTVPSTTPSSSPSAVPSTTPSTSPSTQPSVVPSVVPSTSPSTMPSTKPSVQPTQMPSVVPSTSPSTVPSTTPSRTPSRTPSVMPSVSPSMVPTAAPHSSQPTTFPSVAPSVQPTVMPSTTPTRTPSGTPSTTPSTTPSGTPSVLPTCFPSTTPTKKPTSNACAEAEPWTIGSELIKVNDAVSVFDDEAETLTVRIEWPQKYTVTKLTFLNADGTLDYTPAATNGWNFEFDDEDECLSTLTKTFDWSDAASGGVSLMLNNDDDPPTYTFFVRVEATEDFVKTDSLGNESDGTRILILDLPLKLELQDEIELTADFSVVIDEAMLFDIIEYVAIASTDILERATVNITFTTIMNYPWRLDETSFFLNDTSNVVYDDDPVDLTLTGEECDDVGYEAECKQHWMIIFTSTDMCGAQGWLDIMMEATYEGYEEWLPVEMLLSLGKGTYFDCANVLGTVKLEGEMHVHDAANKYTTAADSTSFYLEDLAYFSATFTSVGPIDAISVKNVDIQQDGQTACTDCTSISDEFELTVERTGTIVNGATTNFIHFYLNLAGQYLIGSTTGGVSTKISITFEVEFAEDPGTGGRRRLLTITVDGGQTETDLNTDQIELASTMNILTSNCGSKVKKGDIRKTACSDKNVHIEICEAAGWKTLVNQCDKPAESSTVVQELSEVESTTSSPSWLIACVVLVVIILSGLGLYYFQSNKHSHYSVQSEKQLNTVIIGETKESQI